MTSSLPGTEMTLRDSADFIPAPPIHALLKAGADPLRMQILKVLEYESFGVSELSLILDCKQSGMSHHLKTLSGAGLVTARREANAIFYQRAQTALLEGLGELQAAILATMNRITLDVEVEQRIEDVQRARIHTGQALFDAMTDDFRELHDQVSPFVLYAKGAAGLLERCATNGGGSALEVGIGEGAFLGELSPRFDDVVGLDLSAAMVDRARAQVKKMGFGNVELLQGTTSHVWLQDMQFDVVTMNMVLHHVASPAGQFIDVAKLLKPGGQFLLCDLHSHNQRSAREACGDVWLGFEEDTLTHWAKLAGLESGFADSLSQRNGLRIQLRQFCKPT
jgi:ubiquinone/menaquinone biosynthesis C-methylase UbiE/DNA-binding transcriptional ArsR family regulator